MNVTQLRAFVSVVDLGSFSEAARQSGISQPAVTMQIKALESEVGATLLERRYHRVNLTEAGHALLPHARNILAELGRAGEDIAALSDSITGRLVIAASTTPGDYVIPRLLGDFVRMHPQVHVEIAVHDTAGAVAAVASGEADLGVCGAETPSAKVVFEELGCDEIVTICPLDHPLAGQTDVPFSALAEADWVGRETGSGTGRTVRAALESHGVDPDELRVIAELGSGEAIVSAVEGGLGIAMLSERVASKALQLGTIARVEVEGPSIRRTFFIVVPNTTPTRAADAFRAYLREALGGKTS